MTRKQTPAEKPGVPEKIIKGSFWLIAAIHIVVFTAIGATTRQWRLLVIFLVGFVLVLAVYAALKIAIKSRPRRS